VTDARGDRVMENFAKLTGGASLRNINRKEVFARVKELIDGMYYLSYVPPDFSKNVVHEVEVKPAPKEKFELSYPRKYLWNP
jgi:hypothetical protein